jgi:CRISPR system Cascade subunit CasA
VDKNLVDDPWLPVISEGQVELVGLRAALIDSQRFDSLTISASTAWVAVVRQVLLPVVADSFGFPDSRAQWGERYARGRLDPGILNRYLDEHRHRFNVFDEACPFAQTSGLRSVKDELKPSSLLVPAMPAGNNVPLFGSRTDNNPAPLPWYEAIIWVLHAHCWDTAGIKTGAAGDPQVKAGKVSASLAPLGNLGVVMPIGRNLFETIMLNMPIIGKTSSPTTPCTADSPQWRRPCSDATWTERHANGLLDLWTWQSRRCRLVPTLDPATGETVVHEVVVTAGDRLSVIPDVEPHTGWTVNEKPQPGELPRHPCRHSPGRSAWRGLAGLVALRAKTSRASRLLIQAGELQAEGMLPEDYPLSVLIVGVQYGTQNAVVESTISDSIPLPVTALWTDLAVGENVEAVASDTDRLVKAVDSLERDLCKSLGGDLAPRDKGERASDRLVFLLDSVARRFLVDVQREPARANELLNLWKRDARNATLSVADSLLAQVPLAAVIGRPVSQGSGAKTKSTICAATAEIQFWRNLRNIQEPSFDTLPGQTESVSHGGSQ